MLCAVGERVNRQTSFFVLNEFSHGSHVSRRQTVITILVSFLKIFPVEESEHTQGTFTKSINVASHERDV